MKQNIVNQETSAQAPAFDRKSIDPTSLVWDPIESRYVPTHYVQVSETSDSKRRNPTPLTILDDPKTMRLDYVRSVVLMHDINEAERSVKGVIPAGGSRPKAGADGKEIVEDRMKAGRAHRFVVVHAVFPMKKQMEEFRKALKLASQKDLFDQRDDLPKIIGINVFRVELSHIGGDVISKEPVTIVTYDPTKNRLMMQPALETLLRQAMYDETTPPVFESYLYEGLAMPLPALAYGRYPRFQFPGWTLAWGDDEPEKKGIAMDKPPPGKKDGEPGFVVPGSRKDKDKIKPNPNPQPGVPADAPGEFDITTIKDDRLKEAEPALSARLFGKSDNTDKAIDKDFNVFQVLGKFLDADKDAKPANNPPNKFGPGGAKPNPLDGSKYFAAWDIGPQATWRADPVVPPKGKDPKGKDAPPPGGVFPPWERDALVRFIDADVVPGKTYYYAVQVRIANPNYRKKVETVAFEDLTRMAELRLDRDSSWVTTPSITIPQDYFLYAMDQHQIDDPAGARKSEKLPPNATTFQIHQWLAEKPDLLNSGPPFVIGDWVVVERQVVRKGERIGAKETVAFPYWRPNREAFELPKLPVDPKRRNEVRYGASIVLKGDDAPILIDFAGGKESAVEALILTFDADGKQRLRVHNSRDDAAAVQPLALVGVSRPEAPFEAITRQERWLKTQRRIQDLKDSAVPPKK